MFDLIVALNKKKVLFDKMLEITEHQKKWIEEENFQRLDGCVNAKSYEIKKINELSHLIEKNDSKNQQNSEAIQINEEINTIIKRIQVLEANNAKKLKAIMDETRKEFKLIQIKKKVNTAYSNAQGVQKDGYYLDKFK